MEQIKRKRWLLTILVVSVLLRVGVAVYYGNWVPLGQDDNTYSQLGLSLSEGQGFRFDNNWYPFTPAETRTAHWSFLYTAFVGAIYGLVGFQPLIVRLAGAILGGVLLPWMVYRLTGQLFSDNERWNSVALLAAACASVYAFFILFAARIMTETFYIVALLWSLERALTLRKDWELNDRLKAPAQQRQGWQPAVLLGVSLGLAVLLRQSVLPWVVVVFAWLLFSNRGSLTDWQVKRFKLSHLFKSRFVASLVVAGAIMMTFVIPFTIRNAIVYEDFLLLNSNAGYAMYSAQHPMHGTNFIEHGAAPLPADLVELELTEAQWDRELMRRGVGFVLDEPGRYLLLSASRVLDYFEFWPTDTSLLHNVGRLISFTLFAPFMAAGLVIAVRREKAGRSWQAFLSTPVALALLFIVFYSLLHIFTWAMPRYRLPVDAVALPFAALAIVELWAAIRDRFAFRLPESLRT